MQTIYFIFSAFGLALLHVLFNLLWHWFLSDWILSLELYDVLENFEFDWILFRFVIVVWLPWIRLSFLVRYSNSQHRFSSNNFPNNHNNKFISQKKKTNETFLFLSFFSFLVQVLLHSNLSTCYIYIYQ